MTEAAALNRVSRSAISHAIRRLEDELGASLLEHQRRSFELTDRGRLLAHEADQLFKHVERLEMQVSALNKANLRGSLRLGVARALATRHLDKIIADFQTVHPSVAMHVALQNSATLVAQLENRGLDLALLIGDESRPNLSSRTLRRGYYSLVIPKGKDMQQLRFAITERRPETERLRHLFQEKWGKALPVFAEIPSWDVIWQWVNNGTCGGLIPDFYLKESKQAKGLDTLLRRVSPYEIRALTRGANTESIVVQEFLGTLARWYKQTTST